MQAYELGCKGCTTYRPNDVTGAVLEVGDKKKAEGAAEPELPLEAPTKVSLPKGRGGFRGRRPDVPAVGSPG